MFAKCVLVGLVDEEPIVRDTDKGRVVSIKVKVVEPWGRQHVSKFKVSGWKERAEQLMRCQPGAKVVVEGTLQQRSWQDQHGKWQSSFEVKADNVVVMAAADRDAGPAATSPADMFDDSDVPAYTGETEEAPF